MEIIKTKIKGTTFIKDSQEKLKRLNKGQRLILIREPENEIDKNAIAVYTEDFDKLGFISKELAENLASPMDLGTIYFAEVLEITGGTEEKENVGCNILINKFSLDKDIMELPNRLYGLENKQLALKRKIEELKFSMNQIESRTFMDVSKETDIDNKKVYTNDEMRKIETAKRLEKNMEFYTIKEEFDLKSYQLSQISNEISYCDRLWKSERAILESRRDK